MSFFFFHFLFFSYPFRPGRTSCSCDYNDLAATSTPPHLHPLPIDPATSTWLRHPTDPITTTTSTPPRCHHLDTALPLPRSRLDTAATASTLLRCFHRRRAPRPAPALSPHSPLDPTTTLPPAPRSSTHTSAKSTQPPLPPQRRRHLPVHPASTPPHRRRFDTTFNLPRHPSQRDPQTSSHSPVVPVVVYII
ncbi:hypothetical protein EDB84DRAFT_988948 [Lactarius hengduanensis]|nr:hypothetical protein EDB84DRAFT_988948 [Lactarius hengduanensis]